MTAPPAERRSRLWRGLRAADSVRRGVPLWQRRAFMLAFVAILTLVPLIVTLDRQSRFESSVEILGSSDPALRTLETIRESGSLVKHVERILVRAGVQQSILANVGLSADDEGVLDDLTIVRGPDRPRRSVIVHLEAGSADQANDLALEVGKQTADTSTFELVADAGQEADAIRRRLRFGSPSPGSRLRLQRRERVLRQAAKGPPLLSLGPNPVRVTKSRKPVDRLLTAFPGDLPPRPNPVVAGLAGLMLALSSCILWLLVRRRLSSTHRPADPRT